MESQRQIGLTEERGSKEGINKERRDEKTRANQKTWRDEGAEEEGSWSQSEETVVRGTEKDWKRGRVEEEIGRD